VFLDEPLSIKTKYKLYFDIMFFCQKFLSEMYHFPDFFFVLQNFFLFHFKFLFIESEHFDPSGNRKFFSVPFISNHDICRALACFHLYKFFDPVLGFAIRSIMTYFLHRTESELILKLLEDVSKFLFSDIVCDDRNHSGLADDDGESEVNKTDSGLRLNLKAVGNVRLRGTALAKTLLVPVHLEGEL